MKTALLIGINEYLMPGGNLHGCVNDVLLLSGVLHDYSIRKLLDSEATKERIENEIYGIIHGASAGDSVVIHFSGHGSNVPDNDTDEDDGRDEIICPHDFDWLQPLRDDWLGEQFKAINPDVRLLVTMDCCHSGTNTRFTGTQIDRSRFIPNPWDLKAAELGMSEGKVRWFSRKRSVIHVSAPEILISACSPKQTAADTVLGGKPCGAFTYCMVQTIKESGGDITFYELHERITRKLAQLGFSQTPQLEGSKRNLNLKFIL